MNQSRGIFAVLACTFFIVSFRQSEPISPVQVSKDPRLYAAVWYGLSAENQACYRQTYRLAEMSLENQLLKHKNSKTPLAIVTDLDETVLDNSAWAFKVILKGKDYPSDWHEWESAGKAPAFSGAVDFFKMAAKKKVEIFYLSNREQVNLPATVSNLQNLGLPFADTNHILLKTTTSNKISRRKMISDNHHIIMLLGDNLADFDGVWEHAEHSSRSQSVISHDADWGNRFIIFPNPVYGGWKEGLFHNKRNWSEIQSDSIWAGRMDDYLKRIGF